MGLCSFSAKYLVFIFNFIIVVLSVALIAIGVIAYQNGHSLMEAGNWKMSAPSLAVIILGVIVFVIAFFGCCGALQESSCMLTTYSILLLTILVLEIVVGALALVYQKEIEDELGNALRPLYDKYKVDKDAEATVDSIQKNFHCCGVDGPYEFGLLKPKSCCRDQNQSILSCEITGSFWDKGCRKEVVEDIKEALMQAGIVVIVFACVELIGVILGLCLANNFRNEDRRKVYA